MAIKNSEVEKKYCKKINREPEEVCVKFVDSFDYIDQIIFGVDDVSQLEKNLRFLNNKKKFIKNI